MADAAANSTSPRWTDAEKAIIRDNWNGPGAKTVLEILALLPGRTSKALAVRATRMGLLRDPEFVDHARSEAGKRSFAIMVAKHACRNVRREVQDVRAGEWPEDAPRFEDMRFKPRTHRDYSLAALASMEWWQIRALDGHVAEQATRQPQTERRAFAAA